MLEYLYENPMLIISIIIFFSCILIGFLADRRISNGEKMKKEEKEDKEDNVLIEKKEDEINDHSTKDEVLNVSISDALEQVHLYPEENGPIESNNNPPAFDETINSDDNVNNMF